jgi:hypothetical protein
MQHWLLYEDIKVRRATKSQQLISAQMIIRVSALQFKYSILSISWVADRVPGIAL